MDILTPDDPELEAAALAIHADLAAAMPDPHGVETFAPGLDWCRDALAVEPHSTAGMPPIDLPDASVDLVTAYSVFTHLNLATNLAWLQELDAVEGYMTRGVKTKKTTRSYRLESIDLHPISDCSVPWPF